MAGFMVFLREKVSTADRSPTTTKMSNLQYYEDGYADNPSSDSLIVKVLYLEVCFSWL